MDVQDLMSLLTNAQTQLQIYEDQDQANLEMNSSMLEEVKSTAGHRAADSNYGNLLDQICENDPETRQIVERVLANGNLSTQIEELL
jgi:hypothetical protein